MQKASWKIASMKALGNPTPSAYPADARTCSHRQSQNTDGGSESGPAAITHKNVCLSHRVECKTSGKGRYAERLHVCEVQNHAKLIRADESQNSGWGGEPVARRGPDGAFWGSGEAVGLHLRGTHTDVCKCRNPTSVQLRRVPFNLQIYLTKTL